LQANHYVPQFCPHSTIPSCEVQKLREKHVIIRPWLIRRHFSARG